MSDDSPLDRLRANATEVASVVVTGIWLGAMFTGQSWWLAFLLIGYVVIVPLVALLFGDESDRNEWWDEWTEPTDRETKSSDRNTEPSDRNTEPSDRNTEPSDRNTEPSERNTNPTATDRSEDARDAESPLETLKRRYAGGELTDDQFERKLERLLEVETIEDLEDRSTDDPLRETDRQ